MLNVLHSMQRVKSFKHHVYTIITLNIQIPLTNTTLWENLADNKSMIFFLFFPENRIRHFIQIVRQFAWNVISCFLGKIIKIF